MSVSVNVKVNEGRVGSRREEIDNWDGGGEAVGEAGVVKWKGGRGDGGARTLDPVF